MLCFASLQNKSGRMGSESFESFELSDSQRGWIWEGIFCLQNLDLLLYLVVGKVKNIPQIVV